MYKKSRDLGLSPQMRVQYLNEVLHAARALGAYASDEVKDADRQSDYTVHPK